jgi:5-methylthioadenosine/S-adenosylhomocysteine deaminase
MNGDQAASWLAAPRGRLSRRRLVGGAALGTLGALQLGLGGQPARGSQAPFAPRAGAPVLVRNASLVITMDPALGDGSLGTIADGDVLFSGDRITAVGPGLAAPGAAVLDAAGKIVLPGFVDVHTHLWQSVFRGGCTDMDVIGWLASCNRPVRGAIAERDMYPIARLSTLGEIETGVTTLVDFAGFFPPPVAREYVRAVAESGLRFHFGFTHPPAALDEVRRLKYELVDPQPRGTFQVTAGAGMADLPITTALARLARELNVKLNIHVLENLAQRAEDHVPALALADALGPTLLIDHAIHLTDEEIDLLAAYDVRVSHNPLSNMRLASGIQRLPELHAAGLKVGLGLDGGTNDTCDMFATMRAAVGLQRAKWLRADVYPTVEDVLRMATLGGAEVLDQADLIGSLTPGKKADLIVLDPGRVNFAPRWDWISQVVFNAQPTNVEYVFVDGQMLKAAGQLVGTSADAAVAAAETAADHLRAALRG